MSKRCEICSLDLQDDHAFKGHCAGKKHLKRLQLSQMMEKSVIITPLPKYIPAQVLLEFLERYGPIRGHQFHPNSLAVEFCNRSDTEALLSRPVWINNIKLNIKKRIPFTDSRESKLKKDNNPTETAGVISYDKIKYIFEEQTTFDDQLVTFLNTVQLTDAEIETRYESICIELDKIFKRIFPRCKTYKFGSTQIGLCFKECDLDIYMDIGERIYETTQPSADVWTMKKVFKRVKNIMYSTKYVFSDIILIPKAKMPIIKFRYVRTNISCDISFKNSLGIYKSNLLKCCISLDNRLKPLMMLIKYWARHIKITGSGKLSNYSLVLLTTFYLQQPSVNIIPPLINFKDIWQQKIVHGWEVNFHENITLPPNTNTSSIPQLLHNFFSFYATFEFKSRVICPIDGLAYENSVFEDTESLPEYMYRYKMCVQNDKNLALNINKPMCVQDPIELNQNITANTRFSTLNSFVKYCAVGAEICKMSIENNYTDLLKTLFTTVLNIKASRFKVTISGKSMQRVSESNNMETCIDAAEKTKPADNNLYLTVCDIAKDIFEKVFKLQVEVVTTDNESRERQRETPLDVDAEKREKHEKLILRCTGTHCVWRHRKISNIVLDPSLSWLQKEAFISEQVIENCAKNNISDKVSLDFICKFTKKDNPLKVNLMVCDQNYDDHSFQEFASFARHKLTEIIERTLMYRQQYNK